MLCPSLLRLSQNQWQVDSIQNPLKPDLTLTRRDSLAQEVGVTMEGDDRSVGAQAGSTAVPVAVRGCGDTSQASCPLVCSQAWHQHKKDGSQGRWQGDAEGPFQWL